MSVIEHWQKQLTGDQWHDARVMEAEIERLKAEWRKADDGWIACRQQLAGAVDTALRELVAEAREVCVREGVEDVAGWIGKTVLARVGGQ